MLLHPICLKIKFPQFLPRKFLSKALDKKTKIFACYRSSASDQSPLLMFGLGEAGSNFRLRVFDQNSMRAGANRTQLVRQLLPWPENADVRRNSLMPSLGHVRSSTLLAGGGKRGLVFEAVIGRIVGDEKAGKLDRTAEQGPRWWSFFSSPVQKNCAREALTERHHLKWNFAARKYLLSDV